MTEKDERQMLSLVSACRSIFMPFDIIEVHRLMSCVVDSYNRVKDGMDMFKLKMKAADDDIKPTDEFYTNCINTYNTVLKDKRELLRKLYNLQMDIAPDNRLINTSKEIEDILNETDIEG